MKRCDGFSLLEVLVAVSLFALAMALAYGGLDAVLRGRAQLDAQADRLREIQTAVGLLERDLRGAVARPVRDGDRLRRGALELDPQGLALSRGGHANRLAQARAEVERVLWRLDGNRLERLRHSRLDRSPGGPLDESFQLDGVSRLEIEVLAEDGRWTARWPAPGSADDLLPRAIRVRLEVTGLGRIERWFELVEGPVRP